MLIMKYKPEMQGIIAQRVQKSEKRCYPTNNSNCANLTGTAVTATLRVTVTFPS